MRQLKEGRPRVLGLDAGRHFVALTQLPRRLGPPPSTTKIMQMVSGHRLKILRLEWRAEVRRSVARRAIVRFLALSSVPCMAILLPLRPQPILGSIRRFLCGF